MYGFVCSTCHVYCYGTQMHHDASCAGRPTERLARFFAGINDWLNGRR